MPFLKTRVHWEDSEVLPYMVGMNVCCIDDNACTSTVGIDLCVDPFFAKRSGGHGGPYDDDI
mgnify:CR=1 FL=1